MSKRPRLSPGTSRRASRRAPDAPLTADGCVCTEGPGSGPEEERDDAGQTAERMDGMAGGDEAVSSGDGGSDPATLVVPGVLDPAPVAAEEPMMMDDTLSVEVPAPVSLTAWTSSTPASMQAAAAAAASMAGESRTASAALSSAADPVRGSEIAATGDVMAVDDVSGPGETYGSVLTPVRRTAPPLNVHRTPRWASRGQDTPDLNARDVDESRMAHALLTPRAGGRSSGLSVAVPWRDDLSMPEPSGLTPRRELDYVPASPMGAVPDFSPFLGGGDLTWPMTPTATASAATTAATTASMAAPPPVAAPPPGPASRPVDVPVPSVALAPTFLSGPPSGVPAAASAAMAETNAAAIRDGGVVEAESPAQSRGAGRSRGRGARRGGASTQRPRQRALGGQSAAAGRGRAKAGAPAAATSTLPFERVEPLEQPPDAYVTQLAQENRRLMVELEEKHRTVQHATHHATLLSRQIAILHQRFRVMQQVEAFSSHGHGSEVEHLARRLTEENSTLRLELEAERHYRGILNGRMDALAKRSKAAYEKRTQALREAEERAARNGLANAENLGLAAKLRRANTVLQGHVRELKARLDEAGRSAAGRRSRPGSVDEPPAGDVVEQSVPPA